ncbi:GldG family protein [Faecalimonas umbilicata]|uniref:GldG family protein n=1 Tax=Faecalimonas umbilicata TaxID=1912855 RepID=UPI002A8274FB|nr:GldG family protein [Faecalimonas umbilicata]MDY4597030.1 GldG family protein [Faecalimonas umbilicata]
MEKLKKLFGTIHTKRGAYSLGLTAVAVAVVIVINLVAGRLPESVRNIDISDNQIYDITDTSKKMLKKLDKKVEIKVLAEKSSTDERIKTFLSKYAALSGKISVEWIDPVLHPAALTEYDTSSNTIVVSCPDTEKTTTISFTDIIVYDQSSYYMTGQMQESQFDAEGQLTSAVNYVTSEETKKIYRTSGHGESTVSTSLSELFEKANLSMEELNLLMNSEIPEDCDLLFMYAPTTDITEDEKNTLSEYLKNGGKMMLISGSEDQETPNLDAFMEEYGLQIADGYIADTDRAYQGNPYSFFPEINASGELGEGMSSNMVLLLNACGMVETDPARDTISVTPFMTTSENGFAVTEDKQEQGEYILGAVATEDEGRLTVISAPMMIDSQLTDAFTTVENLKLFMNAVTSNCDDVENTAVEPKSLAVTYNTVQYAGGFSLLMIFGVPAIILISGFARWMKRRKA